MPSHACARQQLRMVEGATRPLYFCPTCGRRWSRYTFTSGHAAWLSPERFPWERGDGFEERPVLYLGSGRRKDVGEPDQPILRIKDHTVKQHHRVG